MMNLKSKAKKGFLAVTAFALIAGAAAKAQAISITSNDMVLVLYGNGTEYYQNIAPTTDSGPAPGVFSIGASGVSAAGPASTTKWALVSINTDNGTNSGNPSTFNAAVKGSGTNPAYNDFIWNNIGGWASSVSAISTNPNSASIASSAPQSFTSWVDQQVDGSFNGSWTPGTGFGRYGNTLNIISGDFSDTAITSTGLTASLALDAIGGGATLTISALAPVPVPASVVLFATGLVGLVGLARRRMMIA